MQSMIRLSHSESHDTWPFVWDWRTLGTEGWYRIAGRRSDGTTYALFNVLRNDRAEEMSEPSAHSRASSWCRCLRVWQAPNDGAIWWGWGWKASAAKGDTSQNHNMSKGYEEKIRNILREIFGFEWEKSWLLLYLKSIDHVILHYRTRWEQTIRG
jgi:hypothetical protein